MIYSVGIDLIECERIKRALTKWGDNFVERVLGEEELALYKERNDKAQFLAGRFAAKEAVIKTLGALLDTRVHLNDVEVLSDLYGKPYVHLSDDVREKLLDKEIKVSITHERRLAAAVAVLTGE